ncbi:CYTH domain-containing protein [Kitasatospora sp. HPMI-4]|uniref:CYTH domain-containing protein n=1 Tax=Kitasatospora sp. HPMI-4 TaxID=3448443 RepID=UPI003F1BFB33
MATKGGLVIADEIERRFLLDAHPVQLPAAPVRVVQGYLPIDRAGVELRIRNAAGISYLTVKSGSGLVRQEVEQVVTDELFHALWPLTEGARIIKSRYSLRERGHLVELDVFEGVHDGLVIAEVEFPSTAEARAFEPPSWWGFEVTEDSRFRNHRLARDGMPGLDPRSRHRKAT